MNPYPVLPAAALRDLLGVVRALYRAELDAGATPERLEQLAGIGRALRAGLRHSGEHPGTLAYGSAYEAAERAVHELASFAGESPMRPLIAAVVRRFSRPKPGFRE